MPSSPSHKPVRRPRESRRFEDRDLNPKSLTSKAPMEHMENRRRMIGTNRGACAVWHAGTWQDTWQAADAARGIPTQLLVAGEPTTFGALNVTAYGSQQMQPSVGVLESACVWQNASRARWIAAATSASSSPVTVLGTSVSAGCGGGAPPRCLLRRVFLGSTPPGLRRLAAAARRCAGAACAS